MLSSDADGRHLVAAIVRAIASGTAFSSIVRIGENEAGPFAINSRYIHDPDIDYRHLVLIETEQARREPIPWRYAACALILPDRDIAYIKHGTTPMTSLTIGPHPNDDPDIRAGIAAALTSFMQQLLDNQPAAQPAARRAFNTGNTQTPGVAPPYRPDSQRGPHNGHGTYGPRR